MDPYVCWGQRPKYMGACATPAAAKVRHMRGAISMSAASLKRSSIPLDQFVYLFALTMLIQALHMVEHVAQVIQKFVLTRLDETSYAPSPRVPAIAYCQGTPLRNEIEARDASLLDYFTDRATVAIAARFGSGPVAGKIRGHIVVATR